MTCYEQLRAEMPKATKILVNNTDGESSRGFCYIDNKVQANLLAATSNIDTVSKVRNVAVGNCTSLGRLFETIRANPIRQFPHLCEMGSSYRDFCTDDMRRALADTTKACRLFGHALSHRIEESLKVAMRWYIANLMPSQMLDRGR